MPSDMRDELVSGGAEALTARWDAQTYAGQQAVVDAETVLDSVPPGSYKREDGTWVRLQRVESDDFSWLLDHRGVVYTEVDSAE